MGRYRHFLLAFLIFGFLATEAHSQWTQISVGGPHRSLAFGTEVILMPNGNYFVSDPAFDPGPGLGTGAVFLFDGTTHTVISQVVGTRAGDKVGSGGIYPLGLDKVVISSPDWNGNAGAATWMENVGGVYIKVDDQNSLVGKHAGSRVSAFGILPVGGWNYVVISPYWTDGVQADLGAVTWGSNVSGIAGYVSATNSLVGSTAGDLVGVSAVSRLSNGNYVVRTPTWNNGGANSAGAATWGDGSTGISGAVSPVNSIVGLQAGDRVGSSVIGLSNSNYVVASPQWANGPVLRAGAVTVGDGNVGSTGVVSDQNSLVGTSTDDQVGQRVVRLINNGNFIVSIPNWDDPSTGKLNVGAVTWGKGTGGVVGPVTDSNSKLGSNTNDRIGSGAMLALFNGNFVVASPNWYKGRGAVTWGDGYGGNSHGYVSEKNSLVGASGGDGVGSGGVIQLAGSNYAVASPNWDNYVWARDVGAVTWADGANGTWGLVEATNSVIGSTDSDRVGSGGIISLPSGNYVALSPNWNWKGNANAGASTFIPGGGTVSDVVSSSNSIHGTMSGDRVGIGGGTTLGQHYVVASPLWGGQGVDTDGLGAVTWGDGINGTVSGPVSSGNSLTGDAPGDRVGMGAASTFPSSISNGGIAARLPDESVVIASPYWRSGGVNSDGVGAVTWFESAGPTTGVVDKPNSIIGDRRGDLVGSCGLGCRSVQGLQNSGYTIYSSRWDNGSMIDAGALTLAAPRGAITGTITSGNSVLGQVPGTIQTGGVMVAYPWLNSSQQVMVGLPLENRVVFIGP